MAKQVAKSAPVTNINIFKITPLYVFIALIVGYVLISLFLPLNPDSMIRYHLTHTKLRLLGLTVVLPVILIWSAAFYGFSRLRSYAELIKDNKDGKQFFKISNGVGILALGLPIASVISNTFTSLSYRYTHLTPTATIVTNYLAVLVPLLAFITISVGARGLVETVRRRLSMRSVQLITLFIIIIGVIYTYLIFKGIKLGLSVSPHPKSIYYLPEWLLLLTIVVPYVYLWYVGLIAVADLRTYNKRVQGKIYKQSINLLSLGMTAIIGVSIFLQYLTTISARLLQLKLAPLLIVIYPLLLLISVGYILVALAAKNLQKIEEV